MSELSSSAAKAVVWEDVSKVYPNGYQAVRGVSLSVARARSWPSWAPAARGRRRS